MSGSKRDQTAEVGERLDLGEDSKLVEYMVLPGATIRDNLGRYCPAGSFAYLDEDTADAYDEASRIKLYVEKKKRTATKAQEKSDASGGSAAAGKSTEQTKSDSSTAAGAKANSGG